ncbi:MAG TPA: hypothetical protein VHW04_14035 [Solirubrobacteraceae bacterium]|jgi:hypothetical protein|nr:hypothetical protein [Solirubrobacteraceae bacterium]
MTSPIPQSLERFRDELNRAAHHELATASEPARARARLLRGPRVLAGSSLGLAGVGVAVLLALSGSTGTSAAYAITQKSDGTVFVKLNFGGHNTLMAADTKLVDEYHETVMIKTAPGRSTNPAPIDCAATADQYAPGDPTPSGPRVKLLIGKDNTFVGPLVGPMGNSGLGTEHLVSCQTYVSAPNSGRSPGGTHRVRTTELNTGSGNSGNTGS